MKFAACREEWLVSRGAVLCVCCVDGTPRRWISKAVQRRPTVLLSHGCGKHSLSNICNMKNARPQYTNLKLCNVWRLVGTEALVAGFVVRKCLAAHLSSHLTKRALPSSHVNISLHSPSIRYCVLCCCAAKYRRRTSSVCDTTFTIHMFALVPGGCVSLLT